MHRTTTIDHDSTSYRRVTRTAGLAWLGIIVAGIFAEFFVRQGLFVPGNGVETAANIAQSEILFRAGIAADLVMISLDVVVAVALYVLLRPVHRTLAIAIAALRLVQATVLAANLAGLSDALQLAVGTGIDVDPSAVLVALETHALAYDMALVFFGLAMIVLGYVLRAARLIPSVIAIGVTVAGVVYLLGSFASVLAPDAATAIDPLYGLTVAAELAFASWLVRRGLDTPSHDLTTVPAAAA